MDTGMIVISALSALALLMGYWAAWGPAWDEEDAPPPPGADGGPDIEKAEADFDQFLAEQGWDRLPDGTPWRTEQ
jgi:hypothetical protein